MVISPRTSLTIDTKLSPTTPGIRVFWRLVPNVADIAVVGGGILGLAHAYVLARKAKRVVLFERRQRAAGASIRNFGMIWPIGQPAGEMHGIALRSCEIWREALQAARLSYRPTGSLHVAHSLDEADVLSEFAEIGPTAGYSCQWLNPQRDARSQ
jgi:glycine/D-amino acid oxidase-like deaminating enzyme